MNWEGGWGWRILERARVELEDGERGFWLRSKGKGVRKIGVCWRILEDGVPWVARGK